MPFCTIVEFEWSDEAERDRFQSAADAGETVADGRLARIVGIDDAGARVVEAWRSGEEARAFAEATAASVAQMPAPSRVVGCEVRSYVAA